MFKEAFSSNHSTLLAARLTLERVGNKQMGSVVGLFGRLLRRNRSLPLARLRPILAIFRNVFLSQTN
jgi:hypothetical protein